MESPFLASTLRLFTGRPFNSIYMLLTFDVTNNMNINNERIAMEAAINFWRLRVPATKSTCLILPSSIF